MKNAVGKLSKTFVIGRFILIKLSDLGNSTPLHLVTHRYGTQHPTRPPVLGGKLGALHSVSKLSTSRADVRPVVGPSDCGNISGEITTCFHIYQLSRRNTTCVCPKKNPRTQYAPQTKNTLCTTKFDGHQNKNSRGCNDSCSHDAFRRLEIPSNSTCCTPCVCTQAGPNAVSVSILISRVPRV